MKKKKTKAALKRKVGARIETQFDPRYEAPAEVGSPRAHLTYNNVESINEYKCVSSFLCSRRVRTQHHSPSSYLASRKAKVGTRATEWIDTDSPYPRYLRVAESTLGDARSLYETSNERVPKVEVCRVGTRAVRESCACFPLFHLIIHLNTRPNEKDEKQEEEKGAGEEEKKFAANGVSLMNAFFVSGKQRGPGPILPGSCAVR
ncbi:hypothetical protein ALC57_14773 [Trachymyrmex cornetzi]|uniref:Uncharacterized protein n=1 Tax=Trachymyrmex cornetzi TaxID=471704 RepID=A0A195DJL9_9HYME|nr:hypothetical protein ALC57_14773 [Trachymyrmex cornetzi]